MPTATKYSILQTFASAWNSLLDLDDICADMDMSNQNARTLASRMRKRGWIMRDRRQDLRMPTPSNNEEVRNGPF